MRNVRIMLFAVVGIAGVSFLMTSGILYKLFPESGGITCPKDGSSYVSTPFGTRSENFIWKCLACNHTWIETYPEDIYIEWRKAFLEAYFVRDYTILFLRSVGYEVLPNPLKLNWTGGRETPENLVGSETYIYRASDIIITIRYPIILAENVVYTIRLEYLGMTLWKGKLHQRQFTTDASMPLDRAIYNYYGGVGLFKRGINIIATDKDPLALIGSEDFWRMLKDRSTQLASTSDFISILISRGDFSTGGYQIQLKSFAWLESNPVVFSFEANFTDPGNGVMVPEAFTNPLVLVPIGNLDAGRYVVEVHVKSFILTYDISGKIIYTPIETFIEEVWKLEFEIQ